MVAFVRSLIAKLGSATSVRSRIMRAAGWMVIGNGFNQLFAMLTSIGTARMLGKAGFGEFGAVRSTTITLATLAGGGLGLAMTRYVSAYRVSDPQRTARLIRLITTVAWISTGVATILCTVLARPLAVHLMQSEKLALPLALSTLAVMFASVGGVQLGVIAGCEAFKPLAGLLILEGLFAGTFTIIGAWHSGVTGAVAGHVLGTLIAFVLRQRQVRIEYERAAIPRVSLRGSGAMQELPVLFSFVLPTVLLVIGTQPSEWLVRMLLVRGEGGMAELGLFTAAYSWAYLVQFLPSQIAGSAMPVLTNVLTSDPAAFRRMLAESAAVVFGIAAVVALPLAALSPFVMSFYGPAFRDGAGVLTVIVLAYVVGAVSMLLRYSFLSLGKAWLQLAMTGGGGIALPLCFLALRKNGATGLAQSYAIAFVFLTIAQSIAAWIVFRKPVVPAPAMKTDVPAEP